MNPSQIWLPPCGFLSTPEKTQSIAFQFTDNIKRLKGPIKDLGHAKRIREDIELNHIEEDLCRIYEEVGGGLRTQESKDSMVRLEGRRNTLMLEKEEAWRLKSRAIWLEVGDDKTKFFHAY